MTDKHDPPRLEQEYLLRPHQEWAPAEHCAIGRDPRRMTEADLEALGFSKRSLLSIIRAKCIDCCAGKSVRCVDAGRSNVPPGRIGWGLTPSIAGNSPKSNAQNRPIGFGTPL
jgi:hypothetical protein